jgi:hypothetical protein
MMRVRWRVVALPLLLLLLLLLLTATIRRGSGVTMMDGKITLRVMQRLSNLRLQHHQSVAAQRR